MKKTLFFLIFLLGYFLAYSQNPVDLTQAFGPYPGFNGHLNVILKQPDGKFLVGGGFSKYRGVIQNCLIRLNSDGSKDTSFNIGTGIEGASPAVTSIVLQPDGKIVVGGAFVKFNNTTQNCLIRLNSDGSKDTSFDIGTGFDSNVNSVVLQPDGKIIVSGDFWKYQGANQAKLLRLNTNGSPDSSFNVGIGFDGFIVRPLILQPDGKILVGGTFNTFQGTPQNNLVRLNADGSKDTSFNIGTGFSLSNGSLSGVNSLALQPDGKILAGGEYDTYNGLAHSGLIRLNSDGSKDTSFNKGNGFDINNGYNHEAYVSAITIQSDEKILVGGTFIFQGAPKNGLIRLNSDGSKDTSFDIGIGFDTYYDVIVSAICVKPDGKILVGGQYNTYQGVTQNSLVCLNSNGSKDLFFNRTDGFDAPVAAIAKQEDGKMLVGGEFISYNGISQNKLIRFNADGSTDTSFTIGTGFNGDVFSITQQPDKKIIISGWFSTYKGVSCPFNLIRLHPDGSKDNSFVTSTVIQESSNIALQPDGKILVGNDFSTPYMGVPQKGLIRLNSDGSADSSFEVGSQFGSGDIYALAVQSDGKILAGGYFNTSKGAIRNYLIRLNTDGTIDNSFTLGAGFDNAVKGIVVQGDGKILVSGQFTSYQGVSQKSLIRLNLDGTIDPTFNFTDGFITRVQSGSLQNDGKIICISGGSRIIRLNSDGTKDATFDMGTTGFENSIFAFQCQGDGQIYVGGSFRGYMGNNQSAYLARLRGTNAPTPLTAATYLTNASCNTGGSALVSVAGGKSPYTYLWSNGETSSGIDALAAGTYSCTITDADSATITQNFTITFIADTQKPSIIPPAAITVTTVADCTATGLALGIPVTGDNCSVASITNNAPLVFPIGNTIVTWTVKDTSNNTATATQTVIVKETTLPTITAPAAVTVNTTSNCRATGVVLGTPITADNCSVASVINNAPTSFPLGNTTVTWTVKDASNNIAAATQIVTVKDMTLPTITAPATVLVNANSGGTATGVVLGTPTTSDNCTVVSVTNDAPTAFPLGNTTVTWTVKDASNNMATATQIVTVKDVTPPAIIPVANFSSATSVVISNGSVNFKDLSTNTPTSWAWEVTRTGSATLISTLQNPTFTFVDAGTYTVKLTATNAAGSNTKTVVNMITVISPTLIPVANFTAATTTVNNNGSIAFMDSSTNTPTSWAWEVSRTGSATLTSTLQNPSFTFVDAGTYTVKLTATNAAGSNTKTVANMITVFISLPSNNFTVESKSETCANENNGEIIITAKEVHSYAATINGKSYPFVNNSLKVSNLSPATYNVSVTIPGEIFEQNFTINISKGATITAKSTITSQKATVEMVEGSAPYKVFVNGTEQFETAATTFSVDVNKGDLLEVKTAKACEGIYSKGIDGIEGEGSVLAYPNPTNGKIEIAVPTSRKEVAIEIYTINSQLISRKTYTVENGKIQLTIENQPTGVYNVKIYLDQPVSLKIIKN